MDCDRSVRVPIILEAVIGLVTECDIKADVLVSLALIASVVIGETFAAGEVAFIMQLGGSAGGSDCGAGQSWDRKTGASDAAHRQKVDGKRETVIPAEQVQVGDVLRVLPGETIPVDGIIVSGQTSVNQAVMTGESLPVDKAEGDSIFSGTVNQFGAFDMRAVKVGDDGSIQRMIRLVQSVDAGKAKIVGVADRWATWIVVIALAAAALTWLFFRRDYPCGHDIGRILSLRSGSGDTDSDYGSCGQCDEARLSRPGRRCIGTSGGSIRHCVR